MQIHLSTIESNERSPDEEELGCSLKVHLSDSFSRISIGSLPRQFIKFSVIDIREYRDQVTKGTTIKVQFPSITLLEETTQQRHIQPLLCSTVLGGRYNDIINNLRDAMNMAVEDHNTERFQYTTIVESLQQHVMQLQRPVTSLMNWKAKRDEKNKIDGRRIQKGFEVNG